MNIIVTGGHGQVGSELAIEAKKHPELAMINPSHRECDISNPSSIQGYLANKPVDFVINAAAYTQVDQAEVEQDKALRTNATGAAYLSEYCQTQGIKLLHLSTDFVFDGLKKTPYCENDPPHPLNYYGQTKLQGEQCIQKNLTHFLILRVAGVFGLYGHNFIKAIINAAQTKTRLTVVNDQSVTPTSATSIAKTALLLCKKLYQNPKPQLWGIYHYSSTDALSWYDLACYCIDIAKQHTSLTVKEIIPVTTAHYHTLAKRPLYPILNCDKIKQTFAIEQPSWQSSVNHLIQSVLTT